MLNVAESGLNSRQVRIRRLALMILICVIAVFLTAQIIFVTNANHTCVGDGCPICKLIHSAELLLKQFEKSVIFISVIQTVLFVMAMAMMMIGLTRDCIFTPITVKVRLNN